MADLNEDIAAFDRMRAELEEAHLDEWAVFRDGALAGLYPEFADAAEAALERFGHGPYLIRQIGAGAVQFSGGMILRPMHADGSSGL